MTPDALRGLANGLLCLGIGGAWVLGVNLIWPLGAVGFVLASLAAGLVLESIAHRAEQAEIEAEAERLRTIRNDLIDRERR